MYTVFEAFLLRCLINYNDREIQFNKMPPKKSKTLRESLNGHNAERRWSPENVDFEAVLDGENEFIQADGTTTDSSSESVTADAATVQPPIAAPTQPPCRAVTSSRKIDTIKAVKREI